MHLFQDAEKLAAAAAPNPFLAMDREVERKF